MPAYGCPTPPLVGSADKSIDISDAVVATAFVTELLPPMPVPPFVSLVAPVVADAVVVPDAVGVPETVQDMLDPAANVVGGAGVQAPTETPAGKPLTEHDAAKAGAVAAALLVHVTVPEYGVPTVAVAGNPARLGVISEPVTVNAAVAVLFALFPSLVAPVVPFKVDDPVAVGVPETEHVITPAATTVVGGTGEHDEVKPAGNPLIAHPALVAATAGEAALLQV